MRTGSVNEAKELRLKIDSVTNRYNDLVNNIKRMSDEQIMREFDSDQLKKQMDSEIERLRIISHQIQIDIEKTEHEKRSITSEFKSIVKNDQFKKLENRIDRRDFENKISKDQFLRELEKED